MHVNPSRHLPPFNPNKTKDGDLHSTTAGDLAVSRSPSHPPSAANRAVEAVHLRSQIIAPDVSAQPPALKVLDSLKEYATNSNITWNSQTSRGDGTIREGHTLSKTDFGKWAVNDTTDDLPENGTCSCYEIILKAGVQNGLINPGKIHELYQPDVQEPCKWMDEFLCKDRTELLTTNPEADMARPNKGDLILFGDKSRPVSAEQKPSTNVHVVTALGNEEGPVEVLSHHKENTPPVILTLDELLLEMTELSRQTMEFSEPQWF